ncbi:MAG: LamG-like jellyroll fold domain-containing protein, partial [Thermoguttaceae bacterium]
PITLRDYYLGNGVGFSFGWYDADAAGNESWTLEPGATATFSAALPAGADTYEVFARWDLLDGEGDPRDLDGRAKYRIDHTQGSTVVERDQKPELDDEGPDYMDVDGWVSLGTYVLDGSGQVVLTRGTNNPSNWTLADQVKFVSTTHTELVDNPTLDSWSTANAPTTLGSGEYLVLVSNYDAFDYRYDIAANAIPVAGAYTGSFANNGEKVKLMRVLGAEPSGMIPHYRADYVNYDDKLPWPTEPDGDGYSMNRVAAADYGNDPANWSAGTFWGTPGDVNRGIDTSPPTTPTGLSATVVIMPEIAVELTWSASTDAESRVEFYNVFRDGELLGTSETTTYVDTDVMFAVPYSYEVSAVNPDRYESERSASLAMTLPGIDTFGVPDATTIRLTFSEPLVQASAEDVANYAFTGGAISGAVLQPDASTVLLTTPGLIAGQSYTLTIESLETVSGFLMPGGQQVDFDYYPTGSGAILREYWPGIAGNVVSNLTSDVAYPNSPYRRDFPALLEAPVNLADQYGTRMRGYVHPDESGYYTFWIASDDRSELYLSTDDDPANAALIASVGTFVAPRDWTATASQQSAEVYLSAGLRYYVEVLHKEDTGGDHVAVAWQRTGGPLEAPIPGDRLSPYVIEPLDNSPPAAPQNVAAVPLDSARIELTWDAATDPQSGVSYYAVYRDGIEIATTVTTGYVNAGLDQALTYTYEVAAVSGDDFLGDSGAAATASPLPGIESVDATGQSEVVVTFGKPVTEATAEIVGNYSITDFEGQPVNILSAVWNPVRTDEVTLTLTDSLVNNVLYTLTVELVEDNDGQVIEPGASAQFVFGDLHPNLLAWWTFDLNNEATTYDVSGNNHHLSVFGADWDPGGRVDGAYRFDGSPGDYLLDDDAENYIEGLEAFTFAAWLKADAVGNDHGFYFFQDPTGNDRFGFRYDAQLQGQNNAANGMRGAVHTTAGAHRWESEPGTQTTEWQHFAITWSSSNPIEVYLDGALVPAGWSDGLETGALDEVEKLLIGRGSEDANSSWTGLIDEVRIYDAVLTPEEIAALVDTEAPTADIVDVDPDPRATPVDSIDIVLSEPGVTGLDLNDLSLTRGGGGNLLTGAESLTAIDAVTWRLGDLSMLTAEGGNYRLTLTATGSGIFDAAGNPLAFDAIDEWANIISGPTVDITPVSPDPRNSTVDQIEIVFSEEVTGFNLGDLSLTRDGGPNLLVGQTLTQLDAVTWSLGGLTGLTDTTGTYTLTLSADGSGIENLAAEALVVGAVDTWITDATAPTVDVLDIDPDPRGSAVDEIAIVFTEPVFGLTVDDLILTRDDGENLLSGNESLSTEDNITWILSGLGAVTSLPEGTITGFVAYNDHIKGPETHPNTTWYDACAGDAAPAGPASGPLKDIVTGVDTDVTLTITNDGAVFDYKSNPPVEGTPAYEAFHGFVDFAGSDGALLAGVNGFGASIEIAGEDRYVHTFSGLDTGDELTYSFIGTSVRGKVNNRWTLVTLEGTDAAVPSEPQGDGMYVISPTQIAIIGGQNHLEGQGFTAAWTEIDPGADGAFSVVSTHYTGEVPVGSTGGNKSYALTAVRLAEEISTGMPGTYTLRVLAAESAIVDVAGNPLQDDASDTWVTDIPVPTADIVDVDPDPRDAAVDQVRIEFSKSIAGLNVGDLTLTRDGGADLLTGAESLLTDDDTTWTLGDLGGLTAQSGTYVLTLTAEDSGIADAVGYPLVANASDTWTVVESGSQVEGRYIFYNNSAFDENNPDANAADYNAIAPSAADATAPHLGKTALLPGATATFQNYTSYDKGINGIIVDIEGLPETPGLNAAVDFTFRVGNSDDLTDWSPAPDPVSITVAAGDGVGGSDRVTIIWADHAIENQWLQVTVRATDQTGLNKPDVFYFGSAVGEAGNQTINTIVNATDEIVARNFQHGAVDPALVDDPYDYDRDGVVNGTDQIIARGNQTNPLTMLRLITAADAAIEQMAPEALDADLDWLIEYESMNSRDGSAKNTASAVDALLAADWQ